MEIRVTPDTNILVSGILTEGHGYQLLKMAAEGRIKFVLSPDIINQHFHQFRTGGGNVSQLPQ